MPSYSKHSDAFSRSARGQRAHHAATHHKVQKSANVEPVAPLGKELKSISLKDLDEKTSCPKIRSQGWDHMASFNLMDGQQASISIPGIPPAWTPTRDDRALKADAGTYYRDVNAAHNPWGSWQATVETLMGKPHTESFEILACGSTLGNLIRFVSGKPHDCRILVNHIGGVVHFTRREASPKAIIPDVQGYGHTFPEANTTWDRSVKGSTSHQRVVKFSFSGIEMAVRSEADGYMREKAGPLERVQAISSPTTGGLKEKNTLDDLTDAFDSLGSQSAKAHEDDGLKMEKAGAKVPQHAIFDLKTRSIKRIGEEEDIVAGEMHRLWVRRIPTLVLAYHDRGRFTHIKAKDVRPELHRWEEENQDTLRRLARLIRVITAVVKAEPSAKLEIVVKAGAKILQLREQLGDAPALFPSSTAARWEEWLTGSKRGQDSESEDESSEDQGGAKVQEEDEVKTHARDYSVCDDECGFCGECK